MAQDSQILHTLKDHQLGILGLCLMIGMVLSTFLASNAFLTSKRYPNEVVTVTGSAVKDIKSDSAEWTGSFARVGDSMAAAYADLKKDRETVLTYLKSLGITDKEMTVSRTSVTTLYEMNDKGYQTNTIQGYRLQESVSVAASDVEKVDRVSRQSTELISKGIGFSSESPSYYYTKLEGLKVEMLGAATQDAYDRAKSMAGSTGRKIGQLRTAHMGVFQITGKNSTEVSDYGIHDTEAKEKKVSAVVNATFEMVP